MVQEKDIDIGNKLGLTKGESHAFANKVNDIIEKTKTIGDFFEEMIKFEFADTKEKAFMAGMMFENIRNSTKEAHK